MRHAFAGAVLALALLTGCECNSPPGGGDPPPPRDRSLRLVVLIVIDQLPSWTFTRDAGQLEGGLGRLLRESVYFPKAELPYANTYTAPGHAALATGAAPDRSGVLANGWFRGRGGAYVTATSSAEHRLYDQRAGKLATIAAGGAAPLSLRVEGLSDVLARHRPQARSVSIGLKQRAVILMLGKHVTRAAWYEGGQEAMTTSTFYGEPAPWLVAFNQTRPIASAYDTTWDITDREFLRRYTGIDDDSAGEGENSLLGFDRTFPHDLATSKLKAKAVRSLPAAVDHSIAAARAAIDGEKLGQRGSLDLLGLTMSSHDYVGHFWGQESWERFDSLRHVDRGLGVLLDHLDATVGADRYAVILTSDHGAVPLVERSLQQGRKARRIPLADLANATNRGLESVLGKGTWTLGYAANSVYMGPTFAAKPEGKRRVALDAAVAALREVEGVGFVGVTSDLAGDCSTRKDVMERLACRTVHLEETGDITVFPDRFSLFVSPQYTTGTGHGTPSEECREVPILVRIPGVEAHTSTARVNLLQVAPTAAGLLEIPPPKEAKEQRLPLERSDQPGSKVP